MFPLRKDLLFLILQFLNEAKYKETVRKLEKESGLFFNMRYFEDCVTNGEWEEAENYLSGFTKVEDDGYSMKIFFEMRKQKYLEALDKHDQAKAVEILKKDLKVFSTSNEDLFKEMALLLTLRDFRENEKFSKYGDTKSARAMLLVALKELIEPNPLFRDKLQFPTIKTSRLRTLINQSQRRRCKNPKPNPEVKTTLGDHSCGQPSPVTNPLIGSMPKIGNVPPIVALNEDAQSLPEVKPNISDELERSKIWRLAEINEPSQLRSLRLPDSLLAARIVRLIYTNSGDAILSLLDNAVHKLWKWQRNERNLTGKATTAVPPQLRQPSSGILMTNYTSETNHEAAVPCLALSQNDSYVISASGGKISLFNMMTFKTMTTFMPPPPAATFIAFHPEDSNVIAIGMEDSTIQIYHVCFDEVERTLKGHQKRVTGLAFSNVLHVLVSSGDDAQICAWSTDGWEKKANKFLQTPSERAPNPTVQTRVQFHQDRTHVLVVQEALIAVYEASKLDCINQWVPLQPSSAIIDAAYSCDSQLIYTSFKDGSIRVLTAALKVRCKISPAAYLPSNPSLRIRPLVIAAHPSEANQFALGLTDGGVHILEPLESEGKWGSSPPDENSINPGASGVDQTSR